MISESRETFTFLINLAWKSRLTLPLLITAIFMIMDLRPRIEVNIHSQRIVNMDEFDDESDITSDDDDDDDSWETIYEEETTDEDEFILDV